MSEQRPHSEYRIIVNARERAVDHDVFTFDEVVALAHDLPPGEGGEYHISYRHAAGPKEDGDLVQGEKVTVKNGTEFVVESRPKPPHEYYITVNGRERTVDHDKLTYDEVAALAPNLPPLVDGREYIVTYRNAVAPKAEGDLIPGETVTVKNGTEFVVEPGNRS